MRTCSWWGQPSAQRRHRVVGKGEAESARLQGVTQIFLVMMSPSFYSSQGCNAEYRDTPLDPRPSSHLRGWAVHARSRPAASGAWITSNTGWAAPGSPPWSSGAAAGAAGAASGAAASVAAGAAAMAAAGAAATKQQQRATSLSWLKSGPEAAPRQRFAARRCRGGEQAVARGDGEARAIWVWSRRSRSSTR